MPQPPVRPHRRRDDYASASAGRTVGPNAASPDWRPAVEAFLRDARSRECSPSTIDNYRTYLLGPRAEQFLTDYQIHSVADVTPEALRAFQNELLDAGLSAGTAATFHRIIRNFLGFCRREGWGVGEGSLDVAPPHQPTVEPETFTEAEELRIIEAARNDRDRFLIEFMLRTGLRLGEVAAVTLDDVVVGPEGAYLRVGASKGHKPRIVPLDTAKVRFSDALDAYVSHVRPTGAQDHRLFLSRRLDPATGDYGPLDPQGIKMLLRRIGQETGIHVHAHKFRNTFATRALAAGVDSLVLQRALGHTTLAMVNRYVHLQVRDVVDAWRRRTD
jgi:site-specific recombinase XerD